MDKIHNDLLKKTKDEEIERALMGLYEAFGPQYFTSFPARIC